MTTSQTDSYSPTFDERIAAIAEIQRWIDELPVEANGLYSAENTRQHGLYRMQLRWEREALAKMAEGR